MPPSLSYRLILSSMFLVSLDAGQLDSSVSDWPYPATRPRSLYLVNRRTNNAEESLNDMYYAYNVNPFVKGYFVAHQYGSSNIFYCVSLYVNMW